MKNKLPCIRDSRKYFGRYEVVLPGDVVIPCYNYATAKTIYFRFLNKQVQK